MKEKIINLTAVLMTLFIAAAATLGISKALPVNETRYATGSDFKENLDEGGYEEYSDEISNGEGYPDEIICDEEDLDEISRGEDADESGNRIVFATPSIVTNSSGIMTLSGNYCTFHTHSWSASYDGTNLILAFDIYFHAYGNGTVSYYPRYIFGYAAEANMPSNILRCISTSAGADKVTSSAGEITFTEYERVGGLAGERYLKMKGTIKVDPDYYSNLQGGRFRYNAGGWGDEWTAYDASDMTVSGFDTALKQATCTHSAFTYTSSGTSEHKAVCSGCGYSKQESHTLSGGKCTKCSYISTIKLTIKYVLTNKTETETVTLNPGASYQPKSFTGYRTPSGITVPSSDQTIEITLTPIKYTVTDGEKSYSVDYDKTLQLPEIAQKGYTHKSYRVEKVQ